MLDEVPEGSGTLLDNTVVVWTSELSSGNNHSMRNMPYVIAGGASYFDTGRYVRFGGDDHSRLLVSLCHAMGLTDISRVGDDEYDQGPLAGLAL